LCEELVERLALLELERAEHLASAAASAASAAAEQGRSAGDRLVCPPINKTKSGLLSMDGVADRAVKAWEKKEPKLTPIGLQECRHTAASWLDPAGVSPKTASILMGHSLKTSSPTLDRPRGFSRRNLFYMRRFAALWPEREKVQTLSAQIGWSHHQVLLDAFCGDPDVYSWYVAKSVANHWSVRQLQTQIHLRLHERQGAAVSNFTEVVEPPDAQRLLEATKDPYVFDFLDLTEDAQERHLEQALIDDIQNFLIELGSGFAFYGRQQALLVGDQEYWPCRWDQRTSAAMRASNPYNGFRDR
jgi:predicted nuclease of restriction endonuclease-like (RecB) superfamily